MSCAIRISLAVTLNAPEKPSNSFVPLRTGAKSPKRTLEMTTLALLPP
jgi:hypothetical protein